MTFSREILEELMRGILRENDAADAFRYYAQGGHWKTAQDPRTVNTRYVPKAREVRHYATALQPKENDKPALALWLYRGVWTLVQEIPQPDRDAMFNARLRSQPCPFA